MRRLDEVSWPMAAVVAIARLAAWVVEVGEERSLDREVRRGVKSARVIAASAM